MPEKCCACVCLRAISKMTMAINIHTHARRTDSKGNENWGIGNHILITFWNLKLIQAKAFCIFGSFTFEAILTMFLLPLLSFLTYAPDSTLV